MIFVLMRFWPQRRSIALQFALLPYVLKEFNVIYHVIAIVMLEKFYFVDFYLGFTIFDNLKNLYT